MAATKKARLESKVVAFSIKVFNTMWITSQHINNQFNMILTRFFNQVWTVTIYI